MNTQHAIRLLQETCALHHTALSTEKSYIHWLQHYARFFQGPQRKSLFTTEAKIEAFLTHLALQGVSASTDVSIHPILAAAHCCWGNAKIIAVYEWARAIQTGAKAARQSLFLEEGPRRGSVRARDARTKRVIAALSADASFPVDGTSMALKLITDGGQ